MDVSTKCLVLNKGMLPPTFFLLRKQSVELPVGMVGSIVISWGYSPYLSKSNIATENGPFGDVFPIKNGDIPASYVSLPGGSSSLL